MRPLTATSLALALSLGGAAVVAPVASQAQIGFGVGVSVGVAPPPLPYYEQPPAPGYGYIWTPGYWGWSDYDDDYYWVPGTWVLPPQVGFLWTPPWWGWQDGAYVFSAGYWGPFVGFYGGIDYGFGYTGYGYEGGYWRGRDFFYNRSVNNIRNVNITNVYDRPVVTRGGFNRVSFNGPGGVQARPTAQQLSAARSPHLGPTPVQQQHFQMARSQPALRASVNHGAPPIAATARPASLRGPGVVPAARAGGPFHAQTGPNRAPGVAGAPGPQRFGQAPIAGQDRLNGGRGPAGYNGGFNGAYRQTPPRYGQTAGNGAERFNAPRTPPAAQRYSSNTYHAPARDYGGYNGGYRPPAPHPQQAFNGGYRPPQNFGGGGFRPPPQAVARPPQNFGGGGFRPPPQAMARPPQPVMREARAAPAPQQRGEPGRR